MKRKYVSRIRGIDPRKPAYVEQFGLTRKQNRVLTKDVLDQLDRCKDDDARRLIMVPMVGER